MAGLDHFLVRDQKFYLSPTQPDPVSRQFVAVGELQINDQKYFILKEVSPGQQKDAEESLLLTRREIEIVVMVSEGLVNKVIADRLKISEWTVASHIRRTFSKLRVESRAEMVYRCARIIDSYNNSKS